MNGLLQVVAKRNIRLLDRVLITSSVQDSQLERDKGNPEGEGEVSNAHLKTLYCIIVDRNDLTFK